MKNTPSWIYVVAATLCFVAILDMPYGFYTLLRWIVCIASIPIILKGFSTESKLWGWLFIVIVVLFNPFAKVSFDKSIWRVIDAGTGAAFIGFAISGHLPRSKNQTKEE